MPPLSTPPKYASPLPARYASRGPHAAQFIEQHCVIVNDSVAGRAGSPITLRPWQRHLLNGLLALEEGKLKHRQALIGVPRKNGKSALLSSLALWALVCANPGDEIYSVAGDKEQARITHRAAKRMIEANPLLAEHCLVLRDAIELDGAVWRVVSSDSKLKEGLNPTLTLVDEVHVINRDLWDVFSLAQGARPEPLMVGITTAGERYDSLGKDSLCYSLYEYGKRIVSGEIEDPYFYFSWWEPTQGIESDHRDPLVWAQANPGFGDIVSAEDFRSTLPRTPEGEFRTKRLNLWVTSADPALPFGVWDRLTDAQRVVPDREAVCLGFDGSYSGDSTALVGCTIDKPHIFVIDVWEKPHNAQGEWRVPIRDVEQAIIAATKRYDVREIACDPYRWERSLQVLDQDYGLPVVEWKPNLMLGAWPGFYDACLDGELTHDGNTMLARHIDNMVLKRDSRGVRPVKEHGASERHIDLGVAAIQAWTRASQYRTVPLRIPRIFSIGEYASNAAIT